MFSESLYTEFEIKRNYIPEVSLAERSSPCSNRSFPADCPETDGVVSGEGYGKTGISI